MSQSHEEAARWFDDEAGPVVRPYAMTRGRICSGAENKLDLIALVLSGAGTGEEPAHGAGAATDQSLSPEHVDIVESCRVVPQSVAELAVELDLPVGVVRVLIGDLIDAELVHVSRPVPPAELPDESILREVIDGLRVL